MPQGSPLPRILRAFLLWSTVLTVACAATELFCKFVLHLHYPYNFPITNPGAVTQDLLSLKPHFDRIHHREFFQVLNNNLFAYPAPVALPYMVFFFVPGMERTLFYGFCLFVICSAIALFGRRLHLRGVRPFAVALFLGSCLVVSYPFWFELKQGNMEIVVFALIALGVWAFFSDHLWLAATCFGIAGSMKIYPYFLLGLFLTRKDFWKAVYAVGLAAGVTLASLWVIFPDISYTWAQMNAGLNGFKAIYFLSFRDEQAFDHSLWTFLKFTFLRGHTSEQILPFFNLYVVCTGTLGIGLYLWRIRHMPAVNQILCLITAGIVFMPISFDYTLIQIYTPWALLCFVAVDAERNGRNVRGLTAAFACLVLICSPLSELVYHGLSLEGRVKTLALLGLFGIGLRYRFESSSQRAINAHGTSA